MKIDIQSAMCNVDVKDGKDTQPFLMNGKWICLGESSRLMYKRGKEHHEDKEDKSEDIHQVKHWLLENPEIGELPLFNFKIVSTFKDPLTWQLAESVWIERRG